METYCTECHHTGKALDLTRVPFRAGDMGMLVDSVVQHAGSDMPPAPRDRMPSDVIAKIQKWKSDGLAP
jgi:hypothetical protein